MIANCYTGYIIHLFFSYVNISYENLTIGLYEPPPVCAVSRFAKPRSSLAHAACFLGRGRRPDAPCFCPTFSKAGKCSRKGTFKRLCRWEMPRSGKALIWIVLYCNCGTLIRGLQNLESSRKGNGFILFASAKRTKKQPGLRPATSVQSSIEEWRL